MRLFSLFFFFFCLLSLKVFQEYIGRERERGKEQYKNRTEQKVRKSQSNIKKTDTQLREKNEQWNGRERRSVLCYSDRNRFLWKGLFFACSPCDLISVSERYALFNKDIKHSMEFPMTLFHHTAAFSLNCVISLNLSNLMKCSIMFIPWWWCALLHLS